MLVLEKNETANVNVDLRHDVNVKPDETNHILKKTTVALQKDEIAGVNVGLNREVNEKPDETKHVVKTYSKKRRRKQRSSSSKCGVESMAEEVTNVNIDLSHEVNETPEEIKHLLNTAAVVLEKDKMAGVNLLLNHEGNEKSEETKHIVQSNSKKRRRKQRSSSSKCRVESMAEEVTNLNIDLSHEVNETPEEIKHLLNTAAVVLEKDKMAGVNLLVNHEGNEKPEETKHIVQSNSKKRRRKHKSSSSKDCVESMAEKVINVNVDLSHEVNETPEEIKHLLNTAAVVLEKDEMAGVNLLVNHEGNEKPEETKHILQSNSKKRRRKHKSSSSKDCVESMAEEVINVNVDLSHEVNETREEIKHLLNTAAVVLEKDEMAGVNLLVNHEGNEKPEETKHIVQSNSKKRRRKHKSSSSKDCVESMAEEVTNVNVDLSHEVNETPEEIKHLLNTAAVVLEKYEMAGVNLLLNHEGNEKPEETKHIVQSNSKKRRRRCRSSSSKCGVESLKTDTSSQRLPISSMVGTSLDCKSVVSVSGVSVPKTDVIGAVLANNNPSESDITSACEKYHKSPASTTMVVLEKDEKVGVTISLNTEVNEKPEDIKHIVKTSSKKKRRKRRSRSSICAVQSMTAEMIETSSQRLPIVGGTSLDHECVVPAPGVTDDVSTSILKTDVCCANDQRVQSKLRSSCDKHHISPVDTTMVILEKDETAGVNVDLSHGVIEKPEETKHILETNSKNSRRKRRWCRSSKCGVESTTEEMTGASSRMLPINSKGRISLDQETIVSLSGVTDDISASVIETDVTRAVLANDHPVKSDFTSSCETYHISPVDTSTVVLEKDETVGVNVDLSHEVNEEPEKTKHMLNTATVILDKDERDGQNIDMNYKINEKPEEAKHIVKTCWGFSKCGVESMSEEATDTSFQKLPLSAMGGTSLYHENVISKPSGTAILKSRRKLLVLDVNGLLADIVGDFPVNLKPDFKLAGKGVFKRPFCDNFLRFCFAKFDVGIWSSRTKKNLTRVVDLLMKNTKNKLLFCWNQYHCTRTRYKTLENKHKPLVLKELKHLWECKRNLPWRRGFYNESNTILLDDSPYKALRNPPYTAVHPIPYSCKDRKDKSLGPDGDLRLYLERLAEAENVQNFIQANPFGQRSITKADMSWNFYSKIAEKSANQQEKRIVFVRESEDLTKPVASKLQVR